MKRERFVQVRHFDFHARVQNSIQDLDELTQQLATYLDYFGHYLDADVPSSSSFGKR